MDDEASGRCRAGDVAQLGTLEDELPGTLGRAARLDDGDRRPGHNLGNSCDRPWGPPANAWSVVNDSVKVNVPSEDSIDVVVSPVHTWNYPDGPEDMPRRLLVHDHRARSAEDGHSGTKAAQDRLEESVDLVEGNAAVPRPAVGGPATRRWRSRNSSLAVSSSSFVDWGSDGTRA